MGRIGARSNTIGKIISISSPTAWKDLYLEPTIQVWKEKLGRFVAEKLQITL